MWRIQILYSTCSNRHLIWVNNFFKLDNAKTGDLTFIHYSSMVFKNSSQWYQLFDRHLKQCVKARYINAKVFGFPTTNNLSAYHKIFKKQRQIISPQVQEWLHLSHAANSSLTDQGACDPIDTMQRTNKSTMDSIQTKPPPRIFKTRRLRVW